MVSQHLTAREIAAPVVSSRPRKTIRTSEAEFTHARANVLGVKISAVNMEMAVNLADKWIAGGSAGYICVAAVHGITEAYRDTEYRKIMNRALLNVPDGMPLSWIGHLQGFPEMDRVFGPDFMSAMCRVSVHRGYRTFLYGGQPGVAELLSKSLQAKFPGLQVVGTYTPPFRGLTPQEECELIDQVHRSRPHILWVGVSTPRQERFMAKYFKRLEVPLLVGVGAAFDFHTGRIPDCSAWMKRAGLQWLHRLAQEPRRLGKRYLSTNPAFLWHIACQLTGLRQYPIEEQS